MTKCKLCNQETRSFEDVQMNVLYHACDHCGLYFKDEAFLPSQFIEEQEYSRHNNSFESEGYVKMFERFINEAILPFIQQGTALEYGSAFGFSGSRLVKRRCALL